MIPHARTCSSPRFARSHARTPRRAADPRAGRVSALGVVARALKLASAVISNARTTQTLRARDAVCERLPRASSGANEGEDDALATRARRAGATACDARAGARRFRFSARVWLNPAYERASDGRSARATSLDARRSRAIDANALARRTASVKRARSTRARDVRWIQSSTRGVDRHP